MIDFKSKNLILLTGAGFTKNFGGFLGSEMWSQIFNEPEVRKSENLRRLLQKDYDFESAYSSVMTGNFSEEEKMVMRKAVEGAYKNLDEATKDWVFNKSSPYPVNRSGWGKLLSLFIGEGEEKGFLFTLNQDIFLERQYGYRSPGAPPFFQEFYQRRGIDFKSDHFVPLPQEDAVARAEEALMLNSGLFYIKLHGSYGWKASDGSNQMVIGKNKTDLIEKEPLLRWYFELFKKVIAQGHRKVLIVGYGFGDQHINLALVEGVEKHGLEVYIISPSPPGAIREKFEQGGHFYARPILDGLQGYFHYELKEIFPSNQMETTQFHQIKKALL